MIEKHIQKLFDLFSDVPKKILVSDRNKNLRKEK